MSDEELNIVEGYPAITYVDELLLSLVLSAPGLIPEHDIVVPPT